MLVITFHTPVAASDFVNYYTGRFSFDYCSRVIYFQTDFEYMLWLSKTVLL